MKRSTKDNLMPRARIALACLWEGETNGQPLSIRGLCRALGLASQSSVHGHLHVLEKLGLITRQAYMRNGIRVTEEGRRVLGVDYCEQPAAPSATVSE